MNPNLLTLFSYGTGSVLVLVVAGIVYYFGERQVGGEANIKEITWSTYVDPGVTIAAVVVLSILSYNLGKQKVWDCQSCLWRLFA